MRQSGSEKLETIRVVDPGLGAVGKQHGGNWACTSEHVLRLVDGTRKRGSPGLLDRHSGPGFCWNQIPEPVRQQVVDTALEHPESSPRELAWQITDTQGYFISESSVYRILKRCDLITSPAYIVMSASRPVPASHPPCERTLADRLHLFPCGRLGLVLPVHGPG